MSNADYLATAFVQIRPKTTGFQKELREQLKRAVDPIKNTTVLVSPSTTGFAGKLRTQVRDAIRSSGPHTVPVVPTVGAFRAQLTKDLNAKPIPVTVTTVGKGATGGVSGAERAARQQVTTDIARKKITDDLRESERLLKLSTQEGLPLKERDTLVTQAQALARESLARITDGQLASERALVEAQLKARGLKAETAAGREAGRVQSEKDRIDAEAQAAADASAKEKILATTKENLGKVNDRLTLSMDRFHTALRSGADPAKRLSVAERELGVIEKERIALQEQLQGAQRRGEREQADLIRGSVQRAQQFENLIKVEKASLETQKVAQSLSDNEQKIASKLAAATQVEISSLTTLKEVRAQENVLQRQSTALDRLEESSQRSNSAATQTFIATKREEIAARRTALADQGNFIRNSQKEVTQQKNLARGAIATSLSFLGVRGATLAAGGAFLAGAAAVASFAKAIGSAASLETELNVFRLTAQATADQMERVSDTARELGADITLPAVSATDAAESFTALAKAGLNVEDAIDGARGVLQLATAAQISNADATELVASALNAFSLEGTEATHVADLLTGASIAAQGSIEDMGVALQQSSAVARQAGLALEDTVAFITLLAKNGIRGSDAGTSLRTALLRLISPTEDAQKKLQELGVTILDATGAIRPTAFAELTSALQDLEPIARNQVLRKIFGQDAIRAAVIFGREGVEGLNAAREATNQAGLAAELAGARTAGFAGKVEALKNSLSTLGVSIGEFVIGPLAALVEGLNQIVSGFNSAIDAIKDFNRELENVPGIKRLGDEIKNTLFDEPKKGFVELGNFLADDINRTAEFVRFAFGEIQGDAADTAVEIQEIFDTLRSAGVGSPTALNEAALALQDMVERLSEGNEEAQRLAELVQTILKFLQDTGKIPPIDLRVDQFLLPKPPTVQTKGVITFEAALDPRSVFNVEKKAADATTKAAQAAKDAFGDVLSPAVMQAIGIDIMANLGIGAESEATDAATKAANAFRFGLEDQLAIAQAAGTPDNTLLARLRDRERRQQETFDRLNSIPKADRTKAQSERLAQVASNLNATRAAIEKIVEDNAQEAQDAADRIADDQRTATENILRTFAIDERKALNAQILASQTEGLRDDVQANKRLLALYKRQRDEAVKTIKDKEALRDFLAEVNQKIFETEQDIREGKNNLARSIRQQQREARERIVTGIELDIELAVINENRQREIALRRKLIKALEDQIKHEKGNTNKIKQLRNEIARQKQAIKEAQGEAEDRASAFKELLFTFLQTQQGFAANLLGNLIPGGLTGGLVGGTTAGGTSGSNTGTLPGITDFGPVLGTGRGPDGGPIPGRDIATRDAIAQAKAGPTKGGQTRELFLLEQILQTLKAIKTGEATPEAKYQRVRGGSAMDVAM